jgi:hypothetical protein
MNRTLQNYLSVALLATSLATGATLRADAITDWNAIAVQALGNAARPGPSGVVDLATVHVAMYDAVQAIERRYEAYYVEVPGASGSSAAAAAKAARDVLVSRYPSQTSALDAAYHQYLTANGLSPSDPGVAVGAAAAAGIISLRSCDGAFPATPPPPFLGSNEIGVWRSATPAGMVAPWLGYVTPFTMTRPSQFRASPPPALTSRRYAKDYNEVKALGALHNSSRTPEQTDIAQFWAMTPISAWNKTVRDLAQAHVSHIADSARLFALVDMAAADALISSWNDKTHYAFWRPITAIQQGDNDGNSRTIGDATWQPLITTPNYPDHTSGASAYGGAVTRALERFFGTDRITFSITTTNVGPTIQDTRTYSRFSHAANEVVDARMYCGIHFRFSDEAGARQGQEVADWAFENYVRPMDRAHKHSDNDELKDTVE